MRIEEQYKALWNVKNEINSRLVDLDIYKIKELILWLLRSEEYQRLKNKDSQLFILDFFTDIWTKEKKNMNSFEMQGDIFYGVDSLETMERKFAAAKFAVFRLENDMPREHCKSAVEELCRYHFSAYSLFEMIEGASLKKEENILYMARLLKESNELIRAVGLLQTGIEKYPTNKELLLELADCWLMAGQLEQAYECLLRIKQPGKKIREMIEELEKVVKHESV